MTAYPLPSIPWYLQILARVKNHFFLKSIGITLFMWIFFIAYFYLLRNPIFPVVTMPLTALDRAIGFQPGTLVLYISLWVYVTLPPVLQATRHELVYYGWSVGFLCLAGLAFFLFWPTAIPATHVDWESYYGFPVFEGIDAAGNACPSLHVATAVFSGIWLSRQLRDMRAPHLVDVCNWLWCAGIVYSTLATKQHVALDVAAGAMLGLLAAVLSLVLLSRSVQQEPVPLEFGQSHKL